MISDDSNILHDSITGLISLCMVVIGFFTKGVVMQVNQLKDRAERNSLNLAEFKTERLDSINDNISRLADTRNGRQPH